MSPSLPHTRETKHLASLLVPYQRSGPRTQPRLSPLTWQAWKAAMERSSEPGEEEGGLPFILSIFLWTFAFIIFLFLKESFGSFFF